jgi:hypothetical protein
LDDIFGIINNKGKIVITQSKPLTLEEIEGTLEQSVRADYYYWKDFDLYHKALRARYFLDNLEKI